MAIQAKAYANKKAENDAKNRVTVMMSVEEAALIVAKNKLAVTDLFEKIGAVPEVKALVPKD